MTVPRRALIVIDAQQEYFEGLLPIEYPPRDESIARIRTAIDTAERAGIPIVIVRHELPDGAPVFGAGSATSQSHPLVSERQKAAAKHVVKNFSGVFAGTDLEAWLRQNDVDTLTLVGYMTNNCVIASAAAAEPLGFAVEVVSDATGAIDLANEAGSAGAPQVHGTIMALLHSNWAAVADTETWTSAATAGEPLSKSDLVTSASQGRTSR
ncbi:isochorismatase family protein [Arthrobacter sp. KK5.5]|uniref:isochorismatase family protein n=1 Tax=Arthrobacter sp. KK5.5 TaxID=3373084 RepID=UPI003EE49AA9